jgi:aspartate kinase
LENIRQRHLGIYHDLLVEASRMKREGLRQLETFFDGVKSVLEESPHATDYNELYDQVVCLGELASTVIFHKFLEHEDIPSTWVDVRTILR